MASLCLKTASAGGRGGTGSPSSLIPSECRILSADPARPVAMSPRASPVGDRLLGRVGRAPRYRRTGGAMGQDAAWRAPAADRTAGARARLPCGAAEGVAPEFGLYLQGRPPPPMSWSSRWVRWLDWWLPIDRADALDALLELLRRAEAERVEVACSGGHGRTGTAPACLAVLDGVPNLLYEA